MGRRNMSKRRNKVSKRRNKDTKIRNKVTKRRNKVSKRRNKVSKRRNNHKKLLVGGVLAAAKASIKGFFTPRYQCWGQRDMDKPCLGYYYENIGWKYRDPNNPSMWINEVTPGGIRELRANEYFYVCPNCKTKYYEECFNRRHNPVPEYLEPQELRGVSRNDVSRNDVS